MSEPTAPGPRTTPASGVSLPLPGAPSGLTRPPAPAGPQPPRWPARLFATLALATVVGTYVAVEVDLVRRHFPGIEPVKYWLPQVEQVTLPGLGAGLLLGLIALGLHKLGRRV